MRPALEAVRARVASLRGAEGAAPGAPRAGLGPTGSYVGGDGAALRRSRKERAEPFEP